MAFTPISNTVPQYEENGIAASGFYIKFYEAGTTTPTAMATDSTGGTLLDKCELNTEGYPKNGSNAVFIPHIDKKYKIALFRNATDADNNNLNNAVWPVDNMEPVLTEGSGEVATIADLRNIEPAQDGQQISLLGHTLPGIGGGELYFDESDTTSADNNGTIIVTTGGKRWKRPIRPTTVSEFGGIVDGVADDRQALIGALSSGREIRSNESVLISSNIEVSATSLEDYKIKIGSLSGAGVNFTAANSNQTNASDISRLDKQITVNSSSGYSAGDFIVISGVVGHENYTPTRFTDAKFVCRITEISGLVFYLDRPVDFILTSVTVEIMPLSSVTWESDLSSAFVSCLNIPSVTGISECSGDVGVDSGQSFFSVSQCAFIDLDINLKEASCVFGVVANNASSGNIKVNSMDSGGQSIVSTSKILRGNGIQNINLSGSFVSSKNADSSIEGGRNCTLNYMSQSGGNNFFKDGSTAGNRLECIQFSECDGFEITGNVTDSNDQCIELLSCTDCNVYGVYENSKNTESTEGAVVFKGASTDCTFHGRAVGFSSRAIKVEDLDGQSRFSTSPNSVAISDNNEAISIRDSAAPYNTGHVIRGFAKGGVGASCIGIAADSNNVFVSSVVDMENATTGVFVGSLGCNISASGKNNSVNNQLITNGGAAVDTVFGGVSGDDPSVFVNFNGASSDAFTLEKANQLNCLVKFSGVTNFKMIGGQVYADSVPSTGIYKEGDFYQRLSFNTPSAGVVEIGRKYNGTEWKQLFVDFT